MMSGKYLDGLVTLFGGIKLKRALGDLVVNEELAPTRTRSASIEAG